MTEALMPFKPKSSISSSDRSDIFCSECNSLVRNLPVSDTCKICHIPICSKCGLYTSTFDIYCEVHISNVTKRAKKLSKNHYFSLESKNDFFTSKSF